MRFDLAAGLEARVTVDRRLFLMALSAGCGKRRETVLLTFPESYGHHLSVAQGRYGAMAVRAVYLQSYAKMMEALLAGDGDVATAAYDAVLPLAAEGKDVVAFCSLALRPGMVLAAREEIASVEGLKGKTVGIPGPGSSSHFLLNAVMRKNGVSEFSTAAIGVAASAVAAVEQKKVDAAMLTNQGWSTLRGRGVGMRLLVDLRDAAVSREYFGVEKLPSLCLVARREWLEGNGDAARGMAKAFLGANQWMASHTAAEIRAALPEGDEAAIEGMLPTLDVEGRIDIEAASAAFAITAGSVERLASVRLDLRRTFTDAYLR